MIFANCEEAGIFALRAGIGLERDRRESGDLSKPLRQLVRHLAIACRLLFRRERMQFREFRPRDREHFRCRVQLHRARAQRDHRGGEREIARFEPSQITQHLSLGVVRVEHRVSEEVGFSIWKARPRSRRELRYGGFRFSIGRRLELRSKQFADSTDVVFVGGFVEGDPDRMFVKASQVDSGFGRTSNNDVGIGELDAYCVEEIVMRDLDPGLAQRGCQLIGQAVHALRDRA